MGLNILLDIVIPDYDALCPIQAKSCTCWQLSDVDYLSSYTISSRSTALMMVAAAQNTNTMTIRSEGKLAHLEQPLIPPSYPVASQVARDAYNALYNAQNEVACLMLGSMSHELQKALKNYKAYDMIQELKTMFEEQAKQELFETVKAFHACKQEEGIPKKAETPAVLAIREGKIQKDKKKPRGAKGKDKGKNKLAYAPKPKIPPPPKRDNPTKDSICHHCKEGLKGSKKLKHGALSLYIGNGMRAAVEAIRSFDLILPSGLIIILDNCHFTPTVTKGVVSISRLVENGYIHTFTNYGISVSKDNVFYFNAILHDGIYEIIMHNLYPNVSSTFNVSNKRAKHALDSYYLWHCRLGHINKKRVDKLQRDGILQPTHDKSLEKCKSCISGKITRKPFPHQLERAKDLLGLIHTNLAFSIWFQPRSSKGRLIWHRKAHKLSYLRVWGCEALVKRDMPDKLDPRSIKCIFVGYPWVTTSTIHWRTRFLLLEMLSSLRIASWYKKRGVGVTKSARIPQAPDRYGFYVDVEEYELGDLNEPPNYKAALSNPKFDKWFEAMNTEMQSMKDNQVWVLVNLPPNGQTVWSKWLFNKKTDMDGNVHTFKARLVAKGYTQTYHVDYRETFSPVADIRAIRILLAIPAFYDYEIWFDVEIKKIGFTQNPDELCVYLKASGINVAFLILYVDGILLMGNNVTMLQEVKSWLSMDWKSAKPSTTAMSSTEAKYIAAAEESMEVVWIRKFIDGTWKCRAIE
ncbi:retrotransposon protein, putative, ty1-copia subclass [Tanacetum coccineum]